MSVSLCERHYSHIKRSNVLAGTLAAAMAANNLNPSLGVTAVWHRGHADGKVTFKQDERHIPVCLTTGKECWCKDFRGTVTTPPSPRLALTNLHAPGSVSGSRYDSLHVRFDNLTVIGNRRLG